MRHVLDHSQVVRDEEHRHAALRLQIFQQLQHLSLQSHVQGRRGLICDQQVGLAHQGHGNHDALQLSTRQLKRILLKSPLWLTQTHPLQPFDTTRLASRAL